MNTVARVILTIIAVLLIIGVGLITIAALFFGQDISKYFSEGNIDQGGTERSITLSASALKEINLELVSANITIRVEDTDTARITYKLYDGENIEEIISNGSIGLHENQDFSFFRLDKLFKRSSRPVTVTLPSSVKAKAVISVINGKIDIGKSSYTDLRINSTNGTILFSDVVSDSDIYAESVNGELNISGTSASGKITLKTVNGKVSSDKLTADELNCETVNGPVEAYYITCPDIHCETVNGSITSSVYGTQSDYNITFSSVNGNLFVDGSKYGKEADINSGSFNSVKFNTVNGRAEVSFIK